MRSPHRKPPRQVYYQPLRHQRDDDTVRGLRNLGLLVTISVTVAGALTLLLWLVNHG